MSCIYLNNWKFLSAETLPHSNFPFAAPWTPPPGTAAPLPHVRPPTLLVSKMPLHHGVSYLVCKDLLFNSSCVCWPSQYVVKGWKNVHIFLLKRFCSRTHFVFQKQPRILTSLFTWIQIARCSKTKHSHAKRDYSNPKSCMFGSTREPSSIFYFNTCTMHRLLICSMTNKCKIISQIITILPLPSSTSISKFSCW